MVKAIREFESPSLRFIRPGEPRQRMNEEPGISADQALRRLIEGNERFLRGEARFPE